LPYIKKEDRFEATDFPKNAGELNYAITILIQKYLHKNGLNYQHINDIVGALDGAKSEFQRRVVNPYEDKKIKENGDAYAKIFLGK